VDSKNNLYRYKNLKNTCKDAITKKDRFSFTPPYKLVDKSSSPLKTPGPLHPNAWKRHLTNHPNRQFAETLFDIITYGAKLGYEGPNQMLLSRNLTSVANDPETLSADIEHQVSLGKLGKLDTLPEYFISSPLGLVPKSDGSWGRIHHLSHPRNNSVNDHIAPEYGSMAYSTFDEALDLVRAAGPGSILVKRDLANAFRHIPVSPQDYWLFGFQWESTWWYDKFLPFGLRTSPYLFDLFSTGLHWILQHCYGWQEILHYLDDFLSVISATEHRNQEALKLSVESYGTTFDTLCTELGFKVRHRKSQSGTTTEFLGLELNTILMQARLPAEKYDKAINLVTAYLKRRSITQLELQSIIGFLSFAAKVVPLGRPFLCRLYNALSASSPFQNTRLTADMKADLDWWSSFLLQWSGITIIRPSRSTAFIWTDASGTKGIGGYMLLENTSDPVKSSLTARHAFSARVPRHFLKKHIDAK
jgi:hypothetical protein